MSAIILANGEIRDEIIMAGAAMLRAGTPAPDVAEYIAREVEDDPNEFSVGTAGMPNILGEVELDAAFMEGGTRRVGAVAAVKGYRHPISIARQVMERLPHVFLAGDGAMRFAEEIKAERANLLTDESLAMWRERINRAAPGVGSVETLPDLIGFTRVGAISPTGACR
ncbi:MAG TPA: isoaspartyl peptidase/L-asparaginase, partial [Thermoflexales bacterium]|nr:isoaspartyl peptidase/L-asparaginase [Thermoflexales bacterium]